MKKILSVFILLVLLAGCTTLPQPSDKGIVIEMGSDPSGVYVSKTTNVYADIRNDGSRTYRNVNARIFDTGLFSSSGCSRAVGTMKPGDVESMNCALTAPPDITQDSIQSDVSMIVDFSSTLTAVRTAEFMSNEAYVQNQNKGTLKKGPKSASFSDNNIQLDIEFSDEPPFVAGTPKKYVYMTISNIGEGMVSNLLPADVDVQSSVVSCDKRFPVDGLAPLGQQFPRITCDLNVPSSVNYLSSQDIRINIKYNYHIFKTISLQILR